MTRFITHFAVTYNKVRAKFLMPPRRLKSLCRNRRKNCRNLSLRTKQILRQARKQTKRFMQAKLLNYNGLY